MPATTVQVLERAKALIEDPAKFCTRQFAVNENGEYELPESDAACRWCSKGAVIREAKLAGEKSWKIECLLDDVAVDLYGAELVRRFPIDYPWLVDVTAVGVNDRLGQEASIKTFERAIEIAKAAA